VLQVLADPVVVVHFEEDRGPRLRQLILGEDASGRALEIVAVQEEELLVVIHAMDLRPKFRALFEEGLRQ